MRQDDFAAVQILAVAWLVVEASGGRIGEPLAAGVQECEGVDEEHAGVITRHGTCERVVADEVVAPARLFHDDSIALDVVHDGVTMSEPGGVFDFQARLVRQIRQKTPTRIDDFQTPGLEVECDARGFDLGAFCQLIVDPELAWIGAPRNVGHPYIAGRIREAPVGDRRSS